MIARTAGLLFVALTLAFGCTSGFKPVVWPGSAKLGETIAMSLDSNYIPAPNTGNEKHTLSWQNVTIQLRSGSGGGATTLATITPRAVFDGSAAPASIRNEVAPGTWLTIAVFDLPTSLAGVTLPATVTVRPMVGGSALQTNTLVITGSGGSPIAFADTIDADAFADPEDLEPVPALRLQGIEGGGSEGFDEGWEIAGVQFELEYPTTKVENPRASVLTEATGGSIFLGPETTPGRVMVFLTHPSGFYLPNIASNRVGEGPLIDIAFDKLEGEGFSDTDFTIRDLKVVGRDGELLTPAFSSGTDTTAWFALIPRRNVTE